MESLVSGGGLDAGLEAARLYLRGVFTGSPQAVVTQILAALLDLVGLIAVGALLWAGLLLITSGGEQERRDRAVRVVRNALIGLLLILFSRVIVSLVLRTLT